MVELSLETSEHGLPKDCYLSIRVGEVQKLSRLSGTRSFKFPQSTKSRFGKIEVFLGNPRWVSSGPFLLEADQLPGSGPNAGGTGARISAPSLVPWI